MQIIEKEIDDLQPYENNPRINHKAVNEVVKSIKEFGFKVPIVVDEEGTIVAGHTRVEAVKRLGWEQIPAIVADDLTEEQIKAFRIADNKTAQFAEWDYEALLEEIEELEELDYNVELTGFSEVEIDEILDEIEEDIEDEEEEDPEIEFTEELMEEHNYVVLYFDNSLDWQVAQEVFELETKKALDSRPGFEKKGLGRVIRGDKIIDKLKDEEEVR